MFREMQKLTTIFFYFILILHDHEQNISLQSAAMALTVLSVEIYVVTVITEFSVIT